MFLFFSIVDFFRELPQFVVKAGPVLLEIYGPDWENRLQVLPNLFIYTFIFSLSVLNMFFLTCVILLILLGKGVAGELCAS